MSWPSKTCLLPRDLESWKQSKWLPHEFHHGSAIFVINYVTTQTMAGWPTTGCTVNSWWSVTPPETAAWFGGEVDCSLSLICPFKHWHSLILRRQIAYIKHRRIERMHLNFWPPNHPKSNKEVSVGPESRKNSGAPQVLIHTVTCFPEVASSSSALTDFCSASSAEQDPKSCGEESLAKIEGKLTTLHILYTLITLITPSW